ncbi:MAG: hypothetical protein K0S74_1135 [Chlamydiales bacterium]|jgi:predicted nuclease with TOPRIM domain|nr:hypothetical protein [Chlamydiales bacterium]
MNNLQGTTPNLSMIPASNQEISSFSEEGFIAQLTDMMQLNIQVSQMKTIEQDRLLDLFRAAIQKRNQETEELLKENEKLEAENNQLKDQITQVQKSHEVGLNPLNNRVAYLEGHTRGLQTSHKEEIAKLEGQIARLGFRSLFGGAFILPQR